MAETGQLQVFFLSSRVETGTSRDLFMDYWDNSQNVIASYKGFKRIGMQFIYYTI